MKTIDESLKFDTIKLVTDTKYLISFNETLFKHQIDPSTGEIESVAFSSHRHGSNFLLNFISVQPILLVE